LVENPGRLVTQDEVLKKLWPETYVNPEVFRKYIQTCSMPFTRVPREA